MMELKLNEILYCILNEKHFLKESFPLEHKKEKCFSLMSSIMFYFKASRFKLLFYAYFIWHSFCLYKNRKY